MTHTQTHMGDLLDRYDGLLFDAFGVLVQGDGPLPHAATLIEHLRTQARPFAVVTNDATRSIETCRARFARMGMPIDPARIITSGSLIITHARAHGLDGARACVIGPPDTCDYARRAGLDVLSWADVSTALSADVFILGDFPQESTLERLEASTSLLLRSIEAGTQPTLVLPNPDLIYPKSPGHVGLTAGSIAHMMEELIRERHPGLDLSFVRLGKPHAMIYQAGLDLLGTPLPKTLMIGDQLATDILGASRFGMDSAMVSTGLAAAQHPSGVVPTYLIDSLELGAR